MKDKRKIIANVGSKEKTERNIFKERSTVDNGRKVWGNRS